MSFIDKCPPCCFGHCKELQETEGQDKAQSTEEGVYAQQAKGGGRQSEEAEGSPEKAFPYNWTAREEKTEVKSQRQSRCQLIILILTDVQTPLNMSAHSWGFVCFTVKKSNGFIYSVEQC